jgi:hypothetical protein
MMRKSGILTPMNENCKAVEGPRKRPRLHCPDPGRKASMETLLRPYQICNRSQPPTAPPASQNGTEYR